MDALHTGPARAARLLRRGSDRARLHRGSRPPRRRTPERDRRRRARCSRSRTWASTSSLRDRAARAFAGLVDSRARMIIGGEEAVGRALGRGCAEPASRAARGPARPARLRDRRAPGAGRAPACARRPPTTSTCSCPPARPRTRRSSAATRSAPIRRASAGGRGRRSTTAARGSGRRTARSCSRPKPRRGRRAPSSSSRSGSIPSARNRGNAQRALRDLCRRLLLMTPAVCLFVRPENAPAIHVYEKIGMRRQGSYRSVLL